MLTVESLRIQVGEQLLLAGASFEIKARDRVGLTGANGSGKSSLLECLAGRRAPTEGRVRKAPGARLEFLPQSGGLPEAGTVMEAVIAALAPIRAIEADMRIEERKLSEGTGSLERYGDLADRFDAAGGYHAEATVDETLSRLGLGTDIYPRELSTLSGGERRRLALSLALSSGADILLLDEPTTHLDLAGRAYLAHRLRVWPGTLVFASHDRYLLSEACARRLELAGHTATEHPVATRPASRKRVRDSARDTAQRKPHDRSTTALAAKHLTIEAGDRRVIDDVALRIEWGETVAIVGPNGTGKSTLLELLAAERPSDDPRVERHYGPGVRLFWADQRSRGLAPQVPVLAQLEHWVSGPRARQLLGLARVPSKVWRQTPGSLSGGERARAGLALAIATEANLILLDEPEAHLDLAGIVALEHMLVDSGATVVFASHDRMLVEHAADRVMALERGRLREIDGGVSAYLAGWRSPAASDALDAGSRPATTADTGSESAAGTELYLEVVAASAAASAAEAAAATARDALEDERARLEHALLDPLSLADRVRLRIEARLRVVLDELSAHYDTQFPPPPPRVGVREAGVRFGAVWLGDDIEVVGPPGSRARIRRIGPVAHVSLAADPGSELLPWAREALARAATRLAFYLLDVTTLQIHSRLPLHGAGLVAAGSGWWIRERAAFELEEGWVRAGRTIERAQ